MSEVESLKVACAQLDLTVGDIAGNSKRIIEITGLAYKRGVRLLLTPELAISGYAAEDLFLRPGFIQDCQQAVQKVAAILKDMPGMVLVLGHPCHSNIHNEEQEGVSNTHCYNAASILSGGKILDTYYKRSLPNYQVFDEYRYFTVGCKPCVFTVQTIKVGVLICEDTWSDKFALATKQAGAQLLVSINASPYYLGKRQRRYKRMQELVSKVSLPLIYAHMAGAQDELVYDGGSFALNRDTKIVAVAKHFAEDLLLLHLSQNKGGCYISNEGQTPSMVTDVLEDLWHALVSGIHDYVNKKKFPGVLLGLSGGMDSALVSVLAVDALGADRVRVVAMPSRYTAAISTEDAHLLAKNLGIAFDSIPIEPIFKAYYATLIQRIREPLESITQENLQSRIRGMLLMALSNQYGDMVLNTGNKSEIAVGYTTLYGDMVGGFAPIKDVLKTTVYALAKWRNLNDPYHNGLNIIPERIITRPPSAELRPDQIDQDSLPSYDILDAIIKAFVEEDKDMSTIISQGFDHDIVKKVVSLIRKSEHKRKQAPLGTKVSLRSFGKDWRYPVTNQC
jgi:NAD+ synthase (glutamine-hydrolysing)